MVVSPLAALNDTVNVAVVVPTLPSVTDALLTDSTGAVSSFEIVPVPVPPTIVAFVGLLRFTVNVSLASNVVSPLTRTFTVCVVMPGLNVTVPEAAT